MDERRHWRIAGTVVMVLFALLTTVAEGGARERIVGDPSADDVYLFGKSVDVAAPVGGDVVAAGRRVLVQGRVGGDVMAAAEDLAVTGGVGDDVRLAGRNVRIAGPVAGHAVAAGMVVELSRGAQVHDWFWAAGDQVDLSGVVAGDVVLRGGTVVIGGAVGGDSDIEADHVEILPSASFAGDVTIRSRDSVRIPEAVTIGGQLRQERLQGESVEVETGGIGGFGWVALAVLAVVLTGVLPRPTLRSVDTLRRSKLGSVALGLGVLAAAPLLAVLLLATGVGALLGLVVLLCYGVLVLAGASVALSALADLGLRAAGRNRTGFGWRTLALIVATVLAALVSWVPWAGPVVIFVGFLGGLGALSLTLWRGRVPVG